MIISIDVHIETGSCHAVYPKCNRQVSYTVLTFFFPPRVFSRYILESASFVLFFKFVELPNFDVASDAFSTFKVRSEFFFFFFLLPLIPIAYLTDCRVLCATSSYVSLDTLCRIFLLSMEMWSLNFWPLTMMRFASSWRYLFDFNISKQYKMLLENILCMLVEYLHSCRII